MKTRRARMILGCLRSAASVDCGLTDGQLLGRYVARRDGDAFAALVRRHGPMVLSVCRRVLGHAQDAEDAFQAAFVVLARKAGVVADREAVASWLYGVAYRSALQARASGLRRRARERPMDDMTQPTVAPEEDKSDLLSLLDRELARLPEKHRLPLVLCELEGRSRKEAARQLGLPEGTLSSRLARGRRMLARRMAAHGAAVAAASLTALFAGGARAAGVPGRLLISTVRVTAGVIPAGVAAITEGVMKSMLLSKLKATAWGLLLAASLSVGAVALTYRPASAQPAPKAIIVPPAAKASPDRDELEALRLEIEALQLDLKATKERVKVLEAVVQTRDPGANAARSGIDFLQSAPATVKPGSPDAGIQSLPDVGQPLKDPKPLPVVKPLPVIGQPLKDHKPEAQGGWAKPQDGGKSLADMTAAVLAAEVEAAAKKVKEKPDDPEALHELNNAIERLKKAKEQSADPKPMSSLTVSPSAVAIGHITLNEQCDVRVLLRGSRPFRITGLTCPDADAEISVCESDFGNAVQDHELIMRLQPRKTGELRHTIHVATDLPNDQGIDIPVSTQVMPPD